MHSTVPSGSVFLVFGHHKVIGDLQMQSYLILFVGTMFVRFRTATNAEKGSADSLENVMWMTHYLSCSSEPFVSRLGVVVRDPALFTR